MTVKRARKPEPGTEPNFADPTPHPACQVSAEQYPAPRRCAYLAAGVEAILDWPKVDADDICRLGRPATCRWIVNYELTHEAPS